MPFPLRAVPSVKKSLQKRQRHKVQISLNETLTSGIDDPITYFLKLPTLRMKTLRE